MKSSPSISPPEIADHELLQLIGKGSYGEVWRARNVMGAPRAVKIVRRRDFDSEKPFERELDALRSFERLSRQAAGIVRVLQAGRARDDDFLYYVMELADPAGDGADYAPKTLRSVLSDSGSLSVDDCLTISLQLIQGLAALHDAALIHRDVKPSNIIFVHGSAVLADIGLVDEFGEPPSPVGTEGFIPPEGTGRPSADLYALGMTIYEMLTGEGRQNFPAVPQAWLRDEHLREFELFDVILHACEGDPARRYRDAQQMLAELTLLRSGRSVRKLRKLERRASLFRSFGLLMASISLLGGLGWWWTHRQSQQTAEARALAELHLAEGLEQSTRPNARNAALTALDEALALDPSLRMQAGVADQLTAVLAMSDFSNESRWERSGTAPPVVDANFETCADFADGAAWLGSSNQALSDRRRIPCSARSDFAKLSVDGNRLAVVSEAGTIVVWDRSADKPVHTIAGTDAVLAYDLSADGQRLAVLRSSGMLEYRKGSEILWEVEAGVPRGAQQLLRISPDGERVALADGDGIKLCTGEGTETLAFPGTCRALAWDSRSERLAAAGDPSEVFVWDLANTAHSPWLLRGHSAEVIALAFHPDGGVIASSSWDGTTRIWNLGSTRTISVLRSGDTLLQFSADGNRLARGDSATGDVIISTCDFSPLCQIANALPQNPDLWLSGPGREFAVSPDGKFVAVPGSDGLRLFDAASGSLNRRIAIAGGCHSTAFTVDGRSIIAAGACGIVHHEIGGATEIIEAPCPELRGERLSLSPNGRWLAIPANRGVLVFELHAQPVRRHFIELDAAASSAEISPDGTRLLILHSDGRARVIEIASGSELYELTPPLSRPRGAWSPTGDQLVLCGEGKVIACSAATGTRAWAVDAGQTSVAARVVYSADGRFIIAAGDPGCVRLLDAKTGCRLAKFRHPGGETLSGLALSSDSSRLVTARGGVAFWFWDLVEWRKQLAARGLADPMRP